MKIFEKRKIVLKNKTGRSVELEVEIADNLFKQMLGLMFRNSLASNEGMLFIFRNESSRSFWMFNTKIPLDAIFFDSSGKIVEIIQMEPCNSFFCTQYYSKVKSTYVLEVNKGFCERNNIAKGTSLFI